MVVPRLVAVVSDFAKTIQNPIYSRFVAAHPRTYSERAVQTQHCIAGLR